MTGKSMQSMNDATRILMKDGVWLVPPEQRPKGWESYGVAEPSAAPPEPTQEQAAAVMADTADQMKAAVAVPESGPEQTKPKLNGKERQREYQVRLRSELRTFGEIAKAVEESAVDNGCDRDLTKYGRLIVAGMFTNNNSRLCHMTGLKFSEVYNARLRLLNSGIWTPNSRRSNGFCVHVGETGPELPDIGFWLNAMVAAGIIAGQKTDEGMLYESASAGDAKCWSTNSIRPNSQFLPRSAGYRGGNG